MEPQQTTAVLDASADAVFSTLTDLARLPEWNEVITKVLEQPESLRPGAEWVVELHALGSRWPSRSTVLDHDPAERRFRYQSRTDDGNPSRAEWEWQVKALSPTTCEVTVSWLVQPRTFWRRVLLARIRARQLRHREVPASLARLAAAAALPRGQQA